ncbi:MAG TPA: hypothetical protein PKJ42_01980, partial [Candidatus Goldiibacteriota bacterium]|nr:hypothetical protein [Candidatus Goldiibacteriota bacterium]
FSGTKKLPDIMADSLARPFEGVPDIANNSFKAADNDKPGNYTMRLTLKDAKGKTLGTNSYGYEIVGSHKRKK